MSTFNDPDFRQVAQRIKSDPLDVCTRCGRAHVNPGDEYCTSCERELRTNELESKREYARRQKSRSASALKGACTWLKQELRRGPRSTSDLYPRADNAGIHPRTLRRARREIGAVVWREGNGPDHQAFWALPRHAPDHLTLDRGRVAVQSQTEGDDE